MNELLLLAAVVLVACLAGNRLSGKLGIPTLFFFIALGMLFGSDGVFRIEFDNYAFAEQVCSAALIFIMFYGGFGTNVQAARPVAVRSVLLSTVGVLVTAGLTGLFCHLALGMPVLEGMLVGAVLGSTDAASVFSILRSQRLNLRFGTASMLEIESGSNDPCAYMMTVILLAAMQGAVSAGSVVYAVFAQLVYGALAGAGIALAARWALTNLRFAAGMDSILLVAAALAAYAVPSLIDGNGYLGAYLAGILLGNGELPGKKALINFFDAFNGMMQMLIFFLLGLLVFPSRLPSVFLPALAIALFLTLVARPAAVVLLLTPFRAPARQQLIVSWAGLRGAASIVFAITAAVSPGYGNDGLFHIVFCVVLLSILVQGTLLPTVARRAGMIDDRENVMKTFTDYSEETSVQFIRLEIGEGHPWIGKCIRDVANLPGMLIAAVLRGSETIVPKGGTDLREGDSLIVCAKEYRDADGIELDEVRVEPDSRFAYKRLREADVRRDALVVLVRREGRDLIPDGDTMLSPGDTLVLYTNHR